MDPIANARIKEIADSLNADFRCFIHPETGEFAEYPDFSDAYANTGDFFSNFDEDERDAEEAKYEEIELNWHELVPMDSRESFEVMQDFAQQVGDRRVQERLLRALERKRPFANFKDEVDDAGPYRKKWFEFKAQRTQVWVREQLTTWGFTVEAEVEVAGPNLVQPETDFKAELVRIHRLGRDEGFLFLFLLDVFREVFEKEVAPLATQASLDRLLWKGGLVVYVAFYADEVVGGLTAYELEGYYGADKELMIYDIAVRPAFQRKGLGSKLLHALRNYAKKNQFENVWVAANVEDTHALDFYRHKGGGSEDVVHFTFPVKK